MIATISFAGRKASKASKAYISTGDIHVCLENQCGKRIFAGCSQWLAIGEWLHWPSVARARIERLVGTTFGQVNESAVYGILGSSSRGLRDPPWEFPLYIVCRIPLSAVKPAQS